MRSLAGFTCGQEEEGDVPLPNQRQRQGRSHGANDLAELEAQAKARTPWPKTPSMTRAHFDYLARIIANLWPDDETTNTEYVAECFAYHLADTNRRFDSERFIEAATRR